LFHQQKLDANSIGWKSKPSWYVLATKDHTVHPDLQRWVSKRMGAAVTVVESSHVPMLSKPDVVIGVIRKAAAASMEKFSPQNLRELSPSRSVHALRTSGYLLQLTP
jgi:hypothetical protein